MQRSGVVDTAVGLFAERVQRSGDRVALRVLAAGGAPANISLTWNQWHEASRQFAAALIANGHQPGQSVAILAGNTPVWPIADLGVLMAGGVSVGLYPTSAPAQVRHILADAAARVVVADTAEQQDKLHAAQSDSTLIGPEDWDAWLRQGADALERGADAELRQRVAAIRSEDTAILIYTSGSTGEPKGAKIPHRYLLASTAAIQATLGLAEIDSSLSFLPFCHAAERVFGLYARIRCGMEAGLVANHTRIWDAAREFRPTLFGGLPRFYEKVYESLCAEQEASTGDEAECWHRTLLLGRLRSRLRQRGEPVPAPVEREWRQVGEPLFAQVRSFFGGQVRLATSGGAALPAEVAEYLDALGLTVLGAYGLTEHLCAAFHRPDQYDLRSAGPPMPGTEIRIAVDGEILLRHGPLTFAGYHNQPENTLAAFTPDGAWLQTGDLGVLDERGFLRIQGRKKELIALSTGKKIAPLPIEADLIADGWIAQAVLHGEGQKFVAALLTLRQPVVEAWAREQGLILPYPLLVQHPRVRERVQDAVDRVNAGLSRTEQVRRWTVLDRELSLEQDELTPTLKIRRPVIASRFRDQLDALYS